ncbi:MAG: GntR family transcriptional regulator [Chloroflexi bacterium]|nr:GntR family transcriptional regulator [Chloroflexota bacterium]
MSRIIVDPFDVVPKYYQLADIIRQKVERGEWSPSQPIPSERQLETLYNVSRTTIRQALAMLIRQGLLYHEQGKGTFVSPQKLQKGILELTSFSEDMRSRGLVPGQVILDLSTVEPPAKVAQHLELKPDVQRVLRIERIRLGDGKPIGLQVSYLALGESQTITREELENRGSLYALIQEKFHIIPSAADETLEVTVAGPREASLLQVAEGSPLLLSERTLWSQARRAIEFVSILYRGDRYRYYIRLTR